MNIKELVVKRVFIFYMVPQVLLATDINGNYYICTLYDVNSEGDLYYIAAIVSDEELKKLTINLIDLYSVYQDRPIYNVIDNGDENIYRESEIIPESWMLPDKDFYLIDN